MLTSQDQPKPASRPAYKCPGVVLIFLAIALLGLAADLLSKEYVFRDMLNDPAAARRLADLQPRIEASLAAGAHQREVLYLLGHRDVAPGTRFTLSTNPGVVFGIAMPRWLVAVATLLAMGLVLTVLAISDRSAHAVHLAMALIMAGALGNLYDRLFSYVQIPLAGVPPIQYQVRDFIDMSQLHYPWIFNVADVFLVAGVALLLGHRLLQKKQPTSPD